MMYLVPIIGEFDQVTSLSGFFYCLAVIVLLTIAEHLNGWLGAEHRTSTHPDAKCDQRWLTDW